MAVIKCKMCGGDLVLTPDSAIAECEYCGTMQTVPMVDNEKKLSLFNRAHRLRGLCEFDKAAGVYEQIVAEFPEEAEAYWGLVLCDYGIEYVDDPKDGKKIPTCHRSSYSSVMENKDFSLALEYADATARKLYRQEAKQIEQLRREILTVSGREEPYDIFICYKETDETGNRTLDSVLAQDIYSALTEKGYRVFFSRVSLEDKLGQEYEPYIFAALNSARIMLVVGTDYERFQAVWVKNEWSRFLKLMELDKNRYLIPCFRDIDAYDIPSEFARFQAQDLGKVGAIQDLLRGIEKLMPRKNPMTVVREQVLLNEKPNTAPLLRRAKLFLEDRDWDSADKYCEKVLDMEPENGDAYFVKLMAEYKISREEELERIDPACLNSANYQKALRFGDDALQEKLEGIRKDTIYHAAKKLAARKNGREKANLREAITQLQTIPGWRDSAQQIEFCRSTIREMEAREEAQRQEQHQKEQQERQQRAERRRQAEEKRKQERKKAAEFGHKLKIVLSVVCVLVILAILVNIVVVPMLTNKSEETEAVTVQAEAVAEEMTKPASPEELAYVEAEKLQDDGEIAKAAIAFGKLGDYRNARQRSFALWNSLIRKESIYEINDCFYGLKNDGSVVTAGEDIFSVADNPEWENIVQFAGDEDGFTEQNNTCLLGLRSDGTVVAVGQNEAGQCDVSKWTNVVHLWHTGYRIAEHYKDNSGFTHRNYYNYIGMTVGLRSDGTVVTAGSLEDVFDVSGWEDIVDLAFTMGYDEEKTIATGLLIGIRSDGTVVFTGNQNEKYAEKTSVWTDIVEIRMAGGNITGLRSNGTVVSTSDKIDVTDWKNVKALVHWDLALSDEGKLLGNVVNSLMSKVRAEWDDLIYVTDRGDIGFKADGTVVVNAFEGNPNGNVRNWTDVVAVYGWAGNYDGNTIGIRSDGSVLTAGGTRYIHELKKWTDIKIPNPVIQKTGDQVTNATKDYQDQYEVAEALLANGETAKAATAFGKLGDYRDARERSFALWKTLPIKTIDLGHGSMIALKEDGTVFAAYEPTGNKETMAMREQCLKNISEWRDIVSVCADFGVLTGLRSDGTVVCDAYGVTFGNTGEFVKRTSAWENIVSLGGRVAVKTDGTAVGFNYATEWEETDIVDWRNISAIDVGNAHVVGLKTDGTVVAAGHSCCGKANFSEWTDVVSICAEDHQTVGLKSDGSVLINGFGDARQQAAKDWTDMAAVCAGSQHTVGLKTDGTVVAVGYNGNGECEVSGWRDVVAVDAVYQLTVGLKSDGTLLVTGNGDWLTNESAGWTDIRLP